MNGKSVLWAFPFVLALGLVARPGFGADAPVKLVEDQIAIPTYLLG